jgi:geranylgeranyl transferase type-2 subunit beta
MLQVARLAPSLLGEARDLVPAFLRRCLNVDGGFQDRGGESDLYYTVFGLEGLIAFREDPPESTRRYLEAFGEGASLDLVHLSCLARSWASVLPGGAPPETAAGILARLETFRAADGGYVLSRDSDESTVYAAFLALGAVQDLKADVVDPDGLLRSLAACRAADGGYSNFRGADVGLTPSTAGAVAILRQLDVEPDPSLADWLLARCHPDGGFFVAPGAPIPDLLSTATALHALAALHVPTGAFGEPCLDYLDSLWTNAGGFYGSWPDDILDCEYTYYGLLALGHLSL